MSSFFRGTGADQDHRFADKETKVLKQIMSSAPREYSIRVDIHRIKIKPFVETWVTRRMTELLGGFEDEIAIGMVINALLESSGDNGSSGGGSGTSAPATASSSSSSSSSSSTLMAAKLQLLLTPILAKAAPTFVLELWRLLLSAQENPFGIPSNMGGFPSASHNIGAGMSAAGTTISSSTPLVIPLHHTINNSSSTNSTTTATTTTTSSTNVLPQPSPSLISPPYSQNASTGKESIDIVNTTNNNNNNNNVHAYQNKSTNNVIASAAISPAEPTTSLLLPMDQQARLAQVLAHLSAVHGKAGGNTTTASTTTTSSASTNDNGASNASTLAGAHSSLSTDTQERRNLNTHNRQAYQSFQRRRSRSRSGDRYHHRGNADNRHGSGNRYDYNHHRSRRRSRSRSWDRDRHHYRDDDNDHHDNDRDHKTRDLYSRRDYKENPSKDGSSNSMRGFSHQESRSRGDKAPIVDEFGRTSDFKITRPTTSTSGANVVSPSPEDLERERLLKEEIILRRRKMASE